MWQYIIFYRLPESFRFDYVVPFVWHNIFIAFDTDKKLVTKTKLYLNKTYIEVRKYPEQGNPLQHALPLTVRIFR